MPKPGALPYMCGCRPLLANGGSAAFCLRSLTCVWPACLPPAPDPQSFQIFLVPSHDRPGLGTRGQAPGLESGGIPGLCTHNGTWGTFLLSR